MTRWQRLRTFLWTPRGKGLLAVIGLLVAFRLALPTIVKTVVNDRLAHLDGYAGRVLDVDIALWRGAYVLDDMRIERIDEDVPAPFFTADRIDVSIEWGALFRGGVVAEIEMEHPVLTFVGGRTEQTGAGTDWRSAVDDLVPITINHLAIHHGEVHYRDFSSRPRVDVVASALEVEAIGLSTVHDESDPLPAHIDLRSRVQRSGDLHAIIDLDPWDEQPTMDLAVALEGLRAAELNDFLRAYAFVDAEQGRFYVYSEISSRHGEFTGYVKPMIEHLSLFQLGEDGDVVHQALDLFVQVVADLLENHGTDRLATRVDVSGSFDQPGVNALQAFVGVLENTFIRAFEHGFERPSDAWQPDRSRSPVERGARGLPPVVHTASRE